MGQWFTKHSKNGLFLLIALIVLSAQQCKQRRSRVQGTTAADGGLRPSGDPTIAAAITIDPPDFATGVGQFSTDFYKMLAMSTEGNLLLSPFSISTALTMTYLGARGDTAIAMQQALRIPSKQTPSQIGATAAGLVTKLSATQEVDGYVFKSANRLWGQQGYPFLDSFIKVDLPKSFAAGFEPLNFATAPEAQIPVINSWVAGQTENKITDLIKPGFVSRDTRLVLTNAVYFSGKWPVPFEKSRTSTFDFTMTSGEKIPILMMQGSMKGRYKETDSLQVAEFNYRTFDSSPSPKRMCLVLFVPKNNNGLGDFEKTLSAEVIDTLLKQAQEKTINITLPKTVLSSDLDLVKSLEEAGMGLAFDPDKADFSGMADFSKLPAGDKRLAISKVVHSATLSLGEQGTEFAAATAVGVFRSTGAMMDTEPPVTVRADHPFFFILRDQGTGTILALGRMMAPPK